MITIAIIITTTYVILFSLMVYGYFKVPYVDIDEIGNITTRFSIVIPFKNEENYLSDLLQSIDRLNFPTSMFEVIFVDDFSTDCSVQIIETYNNRLPIRLLSNQSHSKSPKKDALEIGIASAKHTWIITTDGDCVFPPNWLKSYDAIIRKKTPEMIIAPVILKESGSFLYFFQQMEFLGLQAVGIGSLGIKNSFLSNGANMAFKKQTFNEVHAYQGNKDLVSGDDVFLLEKFYKKYPRRVVFLKTRQAIVQTAAQKTWKDLIQQKIRWASKTKKYRLIFPKITALIILAMNLLFLICLIKFTFFREIRCATLLILKLFIDFTYIFIINLFYRIRLNYSYYFLSFLIYPLYFILLTVKSLSGGFEWKGNKY